MAEVVLFPSANAEPPDREERLRALDPVRSFLVQAPAGSGKTYLLTQRFLRLLARAERPDEIVAITFTNAAAAEMRNRILSELEKAGANSSSAAAEEEDSLASLARRALDHAIRMDWQILDQPNQLRITTIDAFCRGLALLCPLSWGLLSGLGGRLDPVEQPRTLYRRAASRTMERLLRGHLEQADAAVSDTAASMEALMLWRDNNWNDVENLLVDMLASRNRWYQDFVFDREVDWTALRKRLEASFCRAARERLERLACRLKPRHRDEALHLARFACGNGGKGTPAALAERADFPEWVMAEAETEEAALLEDAVSAYGELANFLLTREQTWRSVRGLNVNVGFPKTPEGIAAKARFGELVEDLEQANGLHAALAAFQKPIPTRFSDEEWELVRHCFAVLRAAAIELQMVFAEAGAVDFIEIAQIALRVLAPEDGLPSEFAMRQADGIHHLLVDEFQDTSRNQHQLLARLVAAWPEREGRTCFCVGDPMQSIYGFRDAEVELFERLKTHGLESPAAEYHAAAWVAEPFPFEFVSLRANFRTVPSLVEDLNRRFSAIFAEDDGSGVHFAAAQAAREGAGTVTTTTQLHLAFTQSMRGRSQAVLESDDGHPKKTREEQLNEMVELIQSRLAEGIRLRTHAPQAKYRIAVLGRTKKSLNIVAEALRRAGVGFRAIELVPLDNRPEVLDALSLARALVNPLDRTAWLGILRAPWCGLTLEELHRITSNDDGATLQRAIPELLTEHLAGLHRARRISDRAYQAASRVEQVMRAAAKGRASGGAAMLGTWIESIWKALGGAQTVGAEEQENLRLLWAALDKLEGGELDLLGPELKQALARLCAQPDPSTSTDFGVQLMTIHKSKGLEFEVVVVPDLEASGQKQDRSLVSWLERGLATAGVAEVTEFLVAPIQGKGEKAGPAKQWVDGVKGERERQEMRRLLYVASTRAREELHLFARPRYGEGKKENIGTRVLDAPQGLLATAWPSIQEEVSSRFASWTQKEAIQHSLALAAEAEESSKVVQMTLPLSQPVKPVVLRRLKAGVNAGELRWLGTSAYGKLGLGAGGPAPAAGGDIEAIGEEDADLYPRTEGGFRSRLEGRAIHSLLERLAVLRATYQMEEALEALRRSIPQTEAMVRSHGLPPPASRALVEQAWDVVQRAARHDSGAWVLAPHAEAQNESRWTGWIEGQARNLRPDRVFVAPMPIGDWLHSAALTNSGNAWWVLDYKTAHAPASVLTHPRPLAEFLAARRVKYVAQLALYAKLLRQLLDESGATGRADLSIRAGVFYPRLALLDWWEG